MSIKIDKLYDPLLADNNKSEFGQNKKNLKEVK